MTSMETRLARSGPVMTTRLDTTDLHAFISGGSLPGLATVGVRAAVARLDAVRAQAAAGLLTSKEVDPQRPEFPEVIDRLTLVQLETLAWWKQIHLDARVWQDLHGRRVNWPSVAVVAGELQPRRQPAPVKRARFQTATSPPPGPGRHKWHRRNGGARRTESLMIHTDSGPRCFNCRGNHRLVHCTRQCSRCGSSDEAVQHFRTCTKPLDTSGWPESEAAFAQRWTRGRARSRGGHSTRSGGTPRSSSTSTTSSAPPTRSHGGQRPARGRGQARGGRSRGRGERTRS
jgi:hypothetical protein